MREPFVHEARLAMAADADEGAPGAAVTVALCGHWEHQGPCRWPHLTMVTELAGSTMTVRTVFASDPAERGHVRDQIVRALHTGRLGTPHASATWSVELHAPGDVTPEDRTWALRQPEQPA
jgi:hypothetical protein